MNLGGWLKDVAGSAAVGLVGSIAATVIPGGRLAMGLIGAAAGGISAYTTSGGDWGAVFSAAAMDGLTAAALGRFGPIRGATRLGRVTGPLIARGLPIGIGHLATLRANPSSSGDQSKASGPDTIPVDILPATA